MSVVGLTPGMLHQHECGRVNPGHVSQSQAWLGESLACSTSMSVVVFSLTVMCMVRGSCVENIQCLWRQTEGETLTSLTSYFHYYESCNTSNNLTVFYLCHHLLSIISNQLSIISVRLSIFFVSIFFDIQFSPFYIRFSPSINFLFQPSIVQFYFQFSWLHKSLSHHPIWYGPAISTVLATSA